MILIGSKDITKAELPNHEVMDYLIDWGKGLDVKLKTMAPAPTCFKVLLDERLKGEVTVLGIVHDKVEYFTDNADLRRKILGDEHEELEAEATAEADGETDVAITLEKEEKESCEGFPDVFSESANMEGFSDEGGRLSEILESVEGFSEEHEEIEETDEVEAKELEDIDEIAEPEKSEGLEETEEPEEKELEDVDEIAEPEESDEVAEPEEVDEVDTELSQDLLRIANIDEDIDSYKLIVRHKDEVIKQKDSMLKELEVQLGEIHLVQDQQVLEIKNMYMEKVEEANAKIGLLESMLEKTKKGEDEGLGKYVRYVKNYKSPLRENVELGGLNSKYKVFASGTGDSFYSMMKQVKKYIEKNPKVVVVDFTGDYYLNTSYGVRKAPFNCIDLTREGVCETKEVFKTIEKTKIAFTSLYNDISLLGVDWEYTLKRIDEYAGGLPVILLFNSITSFSVRYTVSKLKGMAELNLFVKSSPLILSAVYNDILFVPGEDVNFVVMDYIDVVKPIVDLLSKKYKVTAFTGDVDWKKIGLS